MVYKPTIFLSFFFSLLTVVDHEYDAVVVGAGGVERVVEIKLDADERAAFKNSVKAVEGLMEAAKVIAPDLA